MISISNLSFRYAAGEKNALEGINLEIPDGDFLGVIGASGAGKSTLLYTINGVAPHHYPGDFYGQVMVNGRDTIDAGAEALAREVGSVFQDIDGQMVAEVVEDEVLFGLENFSVPRDEIEGRVSEALEAAGIGELRHRETASLSGGQKQKVAIAAVTALKPPVIVLDEPTGELDPFSSRKVFEYLRDLNRRLGLTIVVVEQKIMLLCEFVRRLAVMEKGRLLRVGTVGEVLQEPEVLEAAGVNVPRVTTLGNRLRQDGLYRGRLPQDLPQAVEMMQKVLGGEAACAGF